MGLIDKIKGWFKKGGEILTGDVLKSINDHEKVNIDPAELRRIETSMREYRGLYDKVVYINSQGIEQKRDYKYINMRKISANYLAGLVFNENCEIVVSDANDEEGKENTYKDTDEFIQSIFEHNDFKTNFSQYLEPMYALGGLAVRPYVDNGKIEFAWALADAFYPLRSNSNGISEGVFKSVTSRIENNKTINYTLLEFHEWENDIYIVTNELYRSDKSNEIGKKVDLSILYEDLQEETRLEGLSRPLFNYLKPYGFNNINPHSPLGLGIADNARSTLSQINDTNDQFAWEIKMGQRTVFISDHMLSTVYDETGKPPRQVFDADVNVYKSIYMGDDKEPVKDVTSDIRTGQYIAAINQALKTLEMELGLSAGTFTFDGKSIKTATEVVSENNMTYRTRNNHAHEVENFIKGLIISTLELAKATTYDGQRLFTGDIPDYDAIGVDLDDGVFQDRPALLKFYGQAKTLGLIPTGEIIQRVFNVPKDTAEEWMAIIDQEEGIEPDLIQSKASEKLFGLEE